MSANARFASRCSALRGTLQYRSFIAQSVRRELLQRHKASFLGAGWLVLQPVALIATYSFVFSYIIGVRASGFESPFRYVVFLCSGLLPWLLFSDLVLRGSRMFVDYALLLKKSAIPLGTVPIVVVSVAGFHFAVAALIFLLVLVATGQLPGMPLLYVLVPIALLALLGAAIGVILGALNVFLRDTAESSALVLQFLFWLTPIVYPLGSLPSHVGAWIATLNPLSPVLGAIQNLVMGGVPPSWGSLAIPLLLAGALCVVAVFVLCQAGPHFADEL